MFYLDNFLNNFQAFHLIYERFQFEKLLIKLNYNQIIQDDKLAKVSIIGAGMIANPGVTHKMFRSLADEKINILAISTSEIKISVLIREKLTQKAVKTLHKTFELN